MPSIDVNAVAAAIILPDFKICILVIAHKSRRGFELKETKSRGALQTGNLFDNDLVQSHVSRGGKLTRIQKSEGFQLITCNRPPW